MHSKLRPSPAMVVAAIALFVSLGGTAVATHEVINSSDIVDNEVFSADVRNDGLTGGGLGAADLKPGSVGTSEVVNDTVAGGGLGAADLKASSVGTSEVVNSSLGTADFAKSIPAANVVAPTQSIPSGALTTLAFDSEQYDTASMHDNATNNSRLTAPVTGIYDVTAGVGWVPNGTGRRELLLQTNGTTPIADDDSGGIPLSAGAGQGQSVTVPVRLVAGEFVEAQVVQTSGGPLSVTTGVFAMTWSAPGP